MARHGENIRKRTDGRWEGRYSIFDKKKNQKVYRSVYGKSYEEVKEKLNIQKNAKTHAGAKNGMVPNKTFGKIGEEWLAEIKKTRKRSTYVKYQMIFATHVQIILGDKLLVDLSEELLSRQLSKQLSESILKSIYCVINQILKFAVHQYSIDIYSMKKPMSKTKHKPIEILTKAEQKQLFAVLYRNTDCYKLAVLICLYTGFRLGEVCALKWSDIDMDNEIIHINKTVQRLYVEGQKTKTILVETDPKSGYSKREVPLSNTLRLLLLSFRGDSEYILGGIKPMEPRTLQYHFKKNLAEAGLKNKNFHILRHTFATNCIEGGTDIRSLSEILGHSNVQITLNRYVHPSMDTKRKHLDGLSLFYGQIYGTAGCKMQ